MNDFLHFYPTSILHLKKVPVPPIQLLVLLYSVFKILEVQPPLRKSQQ